MHPAGRCRARWDYQARAHLCRVAQVYYTTPMKKSEVKGYWCHACYTETRSDVIDLDGTRIRKARAQSAFMGFFLPYLVFACPFLCMLSRRGQQFLGILEEW